MVVPFVSGRGVDALDDLLAGAAKATGGARPFTLGSTESRGQLHKLEGHLIDHGPDLGSTSAEHYARQASAFLVRGVMENLPTKIAPATGKIRIYEESTDTFGSYNPDGTTATFFKPDPSFHGEPTTTGRFSQDEQQRVSTCPVCGYRFLDFVPWVEFSSSDEICECCGTQFGYHDAASFEDRAVRAAVHRRLRERWVENGAHWHFPRDKPPPGWNAADQLAALEDG